MTSDLSLNVTSTNYEKKVKYALCGQGMLCFKGYYRSFDLVTGVRIADFANIFQCP